MTRLLAIPNDPISAYLKKGEIKENYFNPGGLFSEVHLATLAEKDVDPASVQALAGKARLFIHPIGRPNPATLPLFFRPMTKLVKIIGPDLIRAHNPWLAGSLAVYTGQRLSIPTVIYLHIENDERRRFDRSLRFRLVKPLEKYSLSRADLVICVSHFLEGYAKRHGARNVATVYNKVFAEQFSRPQPQAFHQPPRILYVGRLDPQKAPEVIIQAVAGLDFDLTLIGDGSERTRLQELVSRLGLAGRVRFIESVPHASIQEHYHRADIFALASHYEGFCIPVLEAMASTLPVVVSDTPPLPEILGGCGLIVAKEPAAFRRALEKLAAEPGPALEMGRRARQRAEELDGRLMEEREVRLYQELLDRTAKES